MQKVCDVLEELVREGLLKSYAIGGATAAGFHGEPLATRDVDVFVFLEPPPGSLLVTLEPLYERLARIGFSEFEQEAIIIHGLPVQFLTASAGLETEAVERALSVEWKGGRMRVIRPEHLAAMAIAVGRPKDRARVVYLWALQGFDRAAFADILTRHALEGSWNAWASALCLGEEGGKTAQGREAAENG